MLTLYIGHEKGNGGNDEKENDIEEMMSATRLIVDPLPQPTKIQRLPHIENLTNRTVLRQVRQKNRSRDAMRENKRAAYSGARALVLISKSMQVPCF